MSSLTAILVTKLGVPVAKALVAIWITDKIGQAAVGGVVDIVCGQLADRLSRAKVDRIQNEIGADLARRIEPYLVSLPGGVAERLADHLSLLAREHLGDTNSLLKGSIDPKAVAKRFANSDERWRVLREQRQFNQAAQDAYDLALPSLAEGMLGHLGRLPNWQQAVALEQLRQLNQLVAALVDQQSAWVNSLEEYERAYHDALRRHCDWMELFGLPPGRAPDAVKSLPLRETFVTLSIRDDGHGPGGIPAPDVLDRLDGKGPIRLVITGDAGSGKTTLMRWIAMTVATGRSTPKREEPGHRPEQEPLKERTWVDWGRRVPFLIRLRRKEGDTADGLPPLHSWGLPDAGGMPDRPSNWPYRLVKAGNALILLDGLDEVEADRRPKLLKEVWDTYLKDSSNACIITSRKLALAGLDSLLTGFDRADVDALGLADRNRLIVQWFEAASRALSPKLLPDPAEKAAELIRAIGVTPALAQLTGNPLLSAMLCALYLGSPNRLPRSQSGVCHEIVEMLLHRDSDQEFRASKDYASMDIGVRRKLVTQIAACMVHSDLAEADWEEAMGFIAERLKRLSLPDDLKNDPNRVLKALTERSAVVRSPQEGKVDFAHNSLRDYLAASAIMDDGLETAAVNKLPAPPWDEITIHMAAHGGKNAADKLAKALLSRRGRTKRSQRELAFMGLAIQAVASELDQGLERQLTGLKQGILPPRSDWEVRKLALMEDLVTSDLVANAAWNEEGSAFAARCLATIGTPKALDALRTYSEDPRESVALEVVQALPLEQCVGFRQWLTTRKNFDRAELPSAVVDRVRRLPDFPADTARVNVQGLSGLTDITAVARLTGLKHLNLDDTAITDLTPLACLIALQELAINDTAATDLTPLAGLTALQRLFSSGTAVTDLTPLAGLSGLEFLFFGRTAVTDLRPIGGLTALKILFLGVTAVNDLTPLAGMTELRTVYLSDTAVTDLAPLERLTALEILELSRTNVTDLTPLAGMAALQHLYLSGTAVTDLTPLAGLTSLSSIDLTGTAVRDLSPLAGIPGLRVIRPDGTRFAIPGKHRRSKATR